MSCVRHWLGLSTFVALVGCYLLSGCASKTPESAGVLSRGAKQGLVQGGSQPVAGASVQLYAVGTTGDVSAATPLLATPAITDSGGAFSITGQYACPSSSSQVYLVATGGNPGLAPGANNPTLALMTALGDCGNLTPSTFIVTNELTTVAAVFALAPYMAGYSSIGSGPADAAALANAFTLASQFVNPATGASPGANLPAGSTVPVQQLNTLADILTVCINSAGGVAGDSTPCGTLLSAATPPGGTAPTNAIAAALNIANNPSANVSALFGLAVSVSPFQPVLTTAPLNFAISLTGTSSLSLSLSPSSLTFPGTAVAMASSPLSVTVTNIGTSTVAFNGVSIIGADAADFSQTADCSSSLTPSATCTVQVTFTPLALGPRNAYLSIASSAPNSPQAIALSGSGSAGTSGPVALSPTTLNFYEQGETHTVTLSNYGTTPLSIAAINISPADWTQANNCGNSLDAQSVCTIIVTAGQNLGQFSGTLTVVDSDTTDSQVVQLTSDIRVTSSSFLGGAPIGYQGGTPKPIQGGVYQFSSNGFGYYIYTGSFSGANPNDFVATPPTCNQHIAGGDANTQANCGIYLILQPTATGMRSAYFKTNMNENFLLKGVGIEASGTSFIFYPEGLDYGSVSVGRSKSLTFTVYNTATTSLTFGTPTLSTGTSNNGDFSFTSSGLADCYGKTLAGSGQYISNCTLTVTFAPTAQGTRFTTVTLTDVSGLQRTMVIIGKGAPSPPVLAPSQLQFGNVAVNSTSPSQVVTVTLPNHDAATAQIETPGTPFQVVGNTSCSQGASTCQFSVAFSPTTTGLRQSSLIVTDTVSGQSASIQVGGTGGIAVAGLSSTSLTYSVRTVGVTSIPQTVTITNTGDIPLVISSANFTGANPTDFSLNSSTCGTVAPSGNCTISISFTPGATGARSASLQIVSNALSSPDMVQLSGTGN